MELIRTNSENPDFIALVRLLDTELAERDGEDHGFYSQFNKIDSIHHVVVGYDQFGPVACGALKPFDDQTVEIKRMYTRTEHRGRGLASQVLASLEIWAVELGYHRCVLETGKKQPEAIALYEKTGYRQIPNYGQYAGIENSLCFEKIC